MGAGKTFSVTGWKLGWAFGPKHLVRNCQVVHQNCVYACPTPIQEAVARAFEKETGRLDSPECYMKSISVDLASKRDYRFVKWLTKNRKLQGIPPSAFFSQSHKHIGENYIRFCFIKHDDSLKKAREILRKWREEIET